MNTSAPLTRWANVVSPVIWKGALRMAFGPNLWAGLTQLLGGNSIALVGTPDQVTDRVVEYVNLGFDYVLLRGFPYLEVITQLGRDVLPRVRAKLATQVPTLLTTYTAPVSIQ